MTLDATIAEASETSDAARKELIRQEMAIARKYIGRFPVAMAVWGVGNLACWLALWPLVLSGLLPLWAAFPIAVVNMSLAYLPSHEAQHSNFARPGERLRWLNELIGYVSTIPLMLPFKVARITHMEHHRHTNDPVLDPDYESHADTWWQAILQSVRRRQPGQPKSHALVLKRLAGTPTVDRAGLEAAVQTVASWGILAALAWAGYAIEAALIWWLPRHIGGSYLSLFLSWAPHHPAFEKGRYRNTRFFTSPLGNVLVLGMEHHAIHHLYPAIPLTSNAAASRELEPILRARGCRFEHL
ncbi:MAG: fatty acid desaturase [Alphaproteobacteria bacterium]|nr:fatty acid desaturase [Alphaproteobacteria bacterium]